MNKFLFNKCLAFIPWSNVKKMRKLKIQLNAKVHEREKEHTEEKKGIIFFYIILQANWGNWGNIKKNLLYFWRRNRWGSSTTSLTEMIPLSNLIYVMCLTLEKVCGYKHNFIFNFFFILEKLLECSTECEENFLMHVICNICITLITYQCNSCAVVLVLMVFKL